MTEELKKAGMPEPVIEEYAGGFQITFLKGSKQTVEKSSEKSSEKLLSLMRINPSISAFEAAIQMSMSSRDVKKIISKLKKEQKIKRIGSAKGGHWEILD